MESSARFIPTVACAAALLLGASASTLAHEGRGRIAKLVGPDGSEARGVVVLTDTRFIVHVEGLPVGDYNVLLDDGTGT